MRKKLYKITIVNLGDLIVTKKQLDEFMGVETYEVVKMEYVGDLVYMREAEL